MNTQSSRPNILVFSVAMNGYQYLYRRNIDSHQHYADLHGYTYRCIQKPAVTVLGMECAWLKVALIIRALRNGYDWVVFFDVDTYVKPSTPEIRTLEVSNKSLYAVKGYSGRLNSGVLIVKNCLRSLNYFKQVLAHIEKPIPAEDNVGWGENGHLIHFAKHRYFVHYLDQRWNNNSDQELDDYIRHYSYGPLYKLFQSSFSDKIGYWALHYSLAVYLRAIKVCHFILAKPAPRVSSQLFKLVNQVVTNYPLFNRNKQEQPLAKEQGQAPKTSKQNKSANYSQLRLVDS